MPTQNQLIEVTVWYRGVVEGRLARQISNGLADAAEREGKYVQAFDNYVDLPDRVNVPCRSYARISARPIEEPYIYENHAPSIIICTDASLVKGCDVLKGLQAGGMLIVNTSRSPESVLGLLGDPPDRSRLARIATLDAGIAHQPYTPQGGIEGAGEKAAAMRTASLLLGVVARTTGLIKLETLLSRAASDAAAIRAGYEGAQELDNPGFDSSLLSEVAVAHGYHGVVDLIVPAQRPNGANQGHITGNYRIYRPVVDQASCTSCRICWVSCPDACITMTGGAVEKIAINLDYCKGCGICWEVCPRDCIEPKEEIDFVGGVVRMSY